jgi:hypothetical protein
MKNKIHIIKSIIVVLSFILAIPLQSQATEYYVDQNLSGSSDSNPGTIAQPWKTITKANQVLIAGDTVYIKAGTYTSYISPNNSGTSSKPITYRNYNSDAVTISNATYGISINAKSYVVVQGINFYNLDNFLWLQNNANHNTIAYCNFNQGRNMGWNGSGIYLGSSYNWVHHCQFSNYGSISTSASGSVLDIGSEESQTDNTSYNLIENNIMFHGGHHLIGIFGRYNVIRNNYLHNEAWSNGYGSRIVYVNGYAANSGWNMIEGNRIGYAGPQYRIDLNSAGMLLANTHNIVRENAFFYNNGTGIAMTLTASYISDITYNKIYNNTFLHNGFNANAPDATTSAIGFGQYGGTWIIKYNMIKNNLYYDNYQNYGYYHVNASDQVFAGNWSGDTQGDPKFVNATAAFGDPLDSSYPDLNVQTSSPVIDTGGALTTITSSNGTGTTFTVADAGYFMDGWGITSVQGDEIQIYGSSQTARITNIDYLTNTITVDKNLTWIQSQGIALSYKGSAPDAGAYEFSQVQAPSPPKNLRLISP